MTATHAKSTTARSAAAFEQMAATGTEVAKNALATAAEGTKAYNAKVLSLARANANAAFDYLDAVLEVTSPAQLLEVSTEHARRQVETLKGQAQELAGVAEKTTAQVVEPLRAQMSKLISQTV